MLLLAPSAAVGDWLRMRPLFPDPLLENLRPNGGKNLFHSLEKMQALLHDEQAERRGGYLRHDEEIEAYGRFFGIGTALKASVVLKELRPEGFETVLDLGAGTCAASLGALHALPSLKKVIAMDRSQSAMRWGQDSLRRFRPNVDVETRTWDALKPGKLPNADLVIIANLLGEIPNERLIDSLLRAALGAAGPNGLVVMIEPGGRAASLGLIRLREAAKNRLPIAGPCTGAPKCPYAENPRAGWCFSELHGERPEWYEKARQLAGIRKPGLTFSWLAFGRRPQHVQSPARAISGHMKVGHYLCTERGRILVEDLNRSPRRGSLLDLETCPRAPTTKEGSNRRRPK